MSAALKRFELENKIITDNDDDDSSYFIYDDSEQKKQANGRPWSKDPHYFKKVKISAIALIKMVIHARSGGAIEVMGSLQVIVLDAFILPVEGTETRVNAGGEANEYMVAYAENSKKVGRLENLVGWYHSHPGYGCWLSGIDVNTQSLNQQFQDPWLAIVVDPNRTMAAGKVEIGAFRTYPKDYVPPDSGPDEYQSIPLEKIEDFGVHCKQYYQLEISYFKSSRDAKLLELIWSKYWMNTLSASPLITNQTYNTLQINDLARKLEQADAQGKAALSIKKGDESILAKITRDATKIGNEFHQGMILQSLKNSVFNLK